MFSKMQKLSIILFVTASSCYSQDEIRTFHRPQQADLDDRLNFIRTVLAKPKLDNEMIGTLEKLRIRAEEIAATNFECNSISINQIPNPRCKVFYLKTLPDFEKEYSVVTGNYYLNKTSLIKFVTDKRSQINECVQAMESFLTKDYSPEKFALSDIESVDIEPIDDQNISATWQIRKHIDEDRAGILRARVKSWNESCQEIAKISSGNSDRSTGSAYFQSQATKHFENTPFQIDGNIVWYNTSWRHQVSINGRKIFDVANPTETSPHIDLSNGELLWKWNESVDGVIKLREGGIAAIAQNEISQSAPLIEYFVDSRDNQKYSFAKIGMNKWMMQNLAFSAASDKWCYDNDSVNCSQFGFLYSWKSAVKSCPKGWRLPSENDWVSLAKYAGGVSYLRDFSYDKGTNRIRFRILPGGYRGHVYDNSAFMGIGSVSKFWTGAEINKDQAKAIEFEGYHPWDAIRTRFESKLRGYSVRCIQ